MASATFGLHTEQKNITLDLLDRCSHKSANAASSSKERPAQFPCCQFPCFSFLHRLGSICHPTSLGDPWYVIQSPGDTKRHHNNNRTLTKLFSRLCFTKLDSHRQLLKFTEKNSPAPSRLGLSQCLSATKQNLH